MGSLAGVSLPQPPTLPHCYRHPDREAGRSCTRCGKPACSSCLVQAAVGSHCLECAKAARPDVKTRVKYANAKVLTPATFAIIGINCLVFLWTALGGGADGIFWGGGERTDQLGVSKLILQGDLYYSYLDRVAEPHEWYRMVTNGFVHFGLVHLAMNMWALYVLGGVLERKLGATRFSLLYVAALLGGTAGIVFIQPTSVGVHGGASGAVFGLMAAMVISLWRQGASIMNSSVGQIGRASGRERV